VQHSKKRKKTNIVFVKVITLGKAIRLSILLLLLLLYGAELADGRKMGHLFFFRQKRQNIRNKKKFNRGRVEHHIM